MILGVSGHRPPKVGGYNTPNPTFTRIGQALEAQLRAYRDAGNLEHVNTGMALGVDQWVAWICIDLAIPFWAIIPCSNFSDRWPDRAREEYEHLISRAQRTVDVTGDIYSMGCLMRRNRWIVDNSNEILAVWNGEREGGTWSTIQYAIRRGIPVRYPDGLNDDFWHGVRVDRGIALEEQTVLPAVRQTPRFHRDVLNSMNANRDIFREANIEPYNLTINEQIARTQREMNLQLQREQIERQQQRRMEQLNEAAAQQAERQRRNIDRRRGILAQPLPPRTDGVTQDYVNLQNMYADMINDFTAPVIPADAIRARTAPEESTPKVATVNTEDRFTPKRFVALDDEDK